LSYQHIIQSQNDCKEKVSTPVTESSTSKPGGKIVMAGERPMSVLPASTAQLIAKVLEALLC